MVEQAKDPAMAVESAGYFADEGLETQVLVPKGTREIEATDEPRLDPAEKTTVTSPPAPSDGY